MYQNHRRPETPQPDGCDPDGYGESFVVITENSTVASFDRAFGKLLGYNALELTGRNAAALFGDERFCDELFRRLRDDPSPHNPLEGRVTILSREGVPIRARYRASLMCGNDHNGFGIVHLSREIGSEKDLEREIQHLARYSDRNPFPVLCISEDGTLLYANRGSWLLLDQWKTEVRQKVPPNWVESARLVLERGECDEIEVEIGFKTILLVLVPMAEFKYVNLFGMDITSRKRVEQKLLQDFQVFENVTEGLMIVDLERRIVDVNRAFCTITGYSREEVLGESVEMLRSRRDEENFYPEMWKSLQDQGSWSGEVWERRKNGEAYPKWLSVSAVIDEKGKVTRYVGMFSDISAMKQTQEQLYHMAHFDSLTGLANRRSFLERLEVTLQQARRAEEQTALLFVDLDGFKIINDNFGHRVGDQLLWNVAERLRECVRESDTVARIGGDEFTVILPNLKNSHNAALVAQKIIQRIAEQIIIDHHEFVVTASIGIALGPGDAADTESLLHNADTAMYRAKEIGNEYQFFSSDMDNLVKERLVLQGKIRAGILAQEFLLHYQPQLNAFTGALVGMEALVRWNNRLEGLIGPDNFIALAEETGLIHQIGEHVLRMSCQQGKLWRDEGLASVRIAVNISANQLRRPGFVGLVESIVKESGFPPGLLEIELTENALIEDIPETTLKLHKLKSLGISLAIDDFGTKYSSLAYLKRLPLDRLKIDRSFVKDLPADSSSMEIASAIIAIAHSLNLEVVAEGVETEEQAELLRAKGCQYIQGNYCCRPMPPDSLRPMLTKGIFHNARET